MVGGPDEAQARLRGASLVERDRIVHFGTAPQRRLASEADLHALHRLNPEHRRTDAGVEALFAATAGPQARRHAEDVDLDEASDGVAILLRLPDPRPDRLACDLVGAEKIAAIAGVPDPRERLRVDLDGRDDIERPSKKREALDAVASQEATGRSSGCGVSRRFAGARAFDHVAAVAGQELHAASQIGVSGTRSRHRGRPVGIVETAVAIANRHRQGTRRGAALANAGEHLDRVLLDALTPASSIAALAATEFRVDEAEVDRKAGGKTFDDRDHCRSVRLAGGSVLEKAHGVRRGAGSDRTPNRGVSRPRSDAARGHAAIMASPDRRSRIRPCRWRGSSADPWSEVQAARRCSKRIAIR